MNRAEATAWNWNCAFPVGTRVRYHSICDEKGGLEPPGLVTKTRSIAWALGDHATIVKVEGVSGGVCVRHCVVLDEGGE